MTELKSLTLNGTKYDSFVDQTAREATKPFLVTVTDNEDGTYSADKTYAEIVEANEAGRAVCCKHGTSLYPLTSVSSLVCIFGCCDGAEYSQVRVQSNDIVSFNTYELEGTVKTVNGIAPDENGNVQIGLPEIYGLVDENNNILLTGALSKGTYTFKYENSDGSLVSIGSYTVTEDSPEEDTGDDTGGDTGEDTGGDTGEEAAVYAVTVGKAQYTSADGNKVYHDVVSDNMQSFCVVHGVNSQPGVYTDSTYTAASETVKPIAVPSGKTAFQVVLPNIGADYVLRCFVVAMSYDESAGCWIKTSITTNSEYGTLANTIPTGAEYLLINVNASGYPVLTDCDFSGVEVVWQ